MVLKAQQLLLISRGIIALEEGLPYLTRSWPNVLGTYRDGSVSLEHSVF